MYVLTFNFHRLQYNSSCFKPFWKPSEELEKITISSAYNKMKSLIKPISIPAMQFIMNSSSRSFKNIENRKGDKHSPCLTPNMHENSSLSWFTNLTFDFTVLYIDLIMFKIFPQMPNLISSNHKLSRTTKSKALVKSTKAQNNFLPWFNICDIKPCKMKTLSTVLIPFLNPACASMKTL